MPRSLALLCTLVMAAGWAWPVRALDPSRSVDQYHVQAWTVRDGLPHNMVHAIAQDSDGYLWLATWEGLARFDGRSFSVYDDAAIPGVRTRGFRTIQRGSDDTLLFGSMRSGVWRHSDGHWYRELASAWTTAVLRSRDGALWVGTEHGLFRRGDTGQLRQVLGPDTGASDAPWIHALLERADGSLWIGAANGLFIASADGMQVQPMPLPGRPDQPVRALMQHADGSIWIALDRGIARHHDRVQRLAPFEGMRVDAMLQDRHGAVWLNTSESGLVRWLDGRRQVLGAPSGLGGRGSSALFEDREGLLWVGTTNGLFRIADGPVRALTTRHGLADDYVRSVLPADDGSMWIGSSGGLDRWQDGRLRAVELPWRSGVPAAVMALSADADALWVGTYDEGVLRVPHDGRSVRRFDARNGLPSDQIRALLTTAEGDTWIGTADGLALHDAQGRLHQSSSRQGFPRGTVRALHQDTHGRLWIGVGDGIAVRETDGRMRLFNARGNPAFPADIAFDILSDPDGTVWIGSDRGVIRYRNDRFDAFGRAQGLPNESIFRLLRDAHGDLWMSSNRGVFQVAGQQFDALLAGQRTRLAPDVYDDSNGMPSSQANGNSFPAGALDAQGQLWIPTAAGVAVIDTQVVNAQPAPRIHTVVEAISASGQPLSLHDAPLRLDWDQAGRLTLRYTALNFRHAHNLRHRYRMEGFDRDWIDAGSATHAIYTNLPPGQYRFRVQSTTRSNDWDSVDAVSEADLPLRITPALWQRVELRLVALALLLGLGALLWRLRMAGFRRQKRALRALIQRRTGELHARNSDLEAAMHEREQLLEQLAWQADHDELTGLWNRRAAQRHLARLADSGRQVHVAVLDVDHFKRINDQHGHEAGDLALQALAHTLRSGCNAQIACARLGGEEFLLVFDDLLYSACLAHCVQMRRAINAQRCLLPGGDTVTMTVSIGLSSGQSGGEASTLLRQADAQLYRAKHAGRDQVCTHHGDCMR